MKVWNEEQRVDGYLFILSFHPKASLPQDSTGLRLLTVDPKISQTLEPNLAILLRLLVFTSLRNSCYTFPLHQVPCIVWTQLSNFRIDWKKQEYTHWEVRQGSQERLNPKLQHFQRTSRQISWLVAICVNT
jgi:hypothetical protein